jgi:hypothetical protein
MNFERNVPPIIKSLRLFLNFNIILYLKTRKLNIVFWANEIKRTNQSTFRRCTEGNSCFNNYSINLSFHFLFLDDYSILGIFHLQTCQIQNFFNIPDKPILCIDKYLFFPWNSFLHFHSTVRQTFLNF